MLTYIYFVKCPNCEDEHFDFFNEAKEYAMSLLSKKPVITQIEVNRNDFGECVDSCDLGTVWSWEEVMKDVPAEPEFTTLSKADTLECDNCFDQEFDSLDNSLDTPVDSVRKPIPADMSIEDLVEAMEENEDEVECMWCNELFDKSECRYEVDLGWLCDRCQAGIKSRGETLTFREGPLDEAFSPSEKVEFIYDSLLVTLQGPKRDVDDWDEAEESVRHSFFRSKEDVATDIWENFIQEADAKDIEGGLETLEDDKAWHDFLATHFDDLLDKYHDKLLAYYEDDARKEYEESHSLEDMRWDEEDYLDEDLQTLETNFTQAELHDKALPEKSKYDLEDPESYREKLMTCPECGADTLDRETGICINCGFII